MENSPSPSSSLTHTALLVLPLETGHPMLAAKLEEYAQYSIRRRNLSDIATTRWYYDDVVVESEEYGVDSTVEYGVRLDVRDLCTTHWQSLLDEIRAICTPVIGPIRIDNQG